MFLRTTILGLTLLALGSPTVFAAPPKASTPGSIHVFLVACSEYDNDKQFNTLPFTVLETEEFRALLVRSGVPAGNVKFLRDLVDPKADKRFVPRKKNILNELEVLLNRLEADDTIIVAFNGHGIQPVGAKTAYFCPANADLEDINTLIALEGEKGLYTLLKDAAPKRKLLLVNACRDDPKSLKPTQSVNKVNFDKQHRYDPPEGIAALFSCRPGQFTYYYPQGNQRPQRSLFFHHLMQAWEGKYASGKAVTLEDVFREVSKRTATEADSLFGDGQNPVVRREYANEWLIRSEGQDEPNDPKPGEERSFEIADGVKMVFCWIPAGEVQLGSPKEERAAVLKEIEADKEPAWLASEAEGLRGKYRTNGFWLAKYSVMQKEYEAVMGKNPSNFISTEAQLKKDGITDTSRFPVERVSWDDSQEFMQKLNRRSGAEKVFGKAGKFALPHEDAWEYAYRGGKGNQQAFYWGNTLNGDKANCDGNYPYGGVAKGKYLKRTCAVGSYAEKAPHPWGLCDMSGNVWQWCDNLYSSEQKGRIVRGGSWDHFGSGLCRGASRDWHAPDLRTNYLGFRVCLRLD